MKITLNKTKRIRKKEYYRIYIGGPLDGREDRCGIKYRVKIPRLVDKSCWPKGPSGEIEHNYYVCAEPQHVPAHNARIIYEYTPRLSVESQVECDHETQIPNHHHSPRDPLFLDRPERPAPNVLDAGRQLLRPAHAAAASATADELHRASAYPTGRNATARNGEAARDMSVILEAEGPHHIGTPTVVKQMSEITEQLIALIRARDAAGLAKYGVTLDRKDLTIEQWLMHQAEELADGAGYALAAMREVKELRAKMDDAPLTVIVDGVEWTREEAIAVLNKRTEERDSAEKALRALGYEKHGIGWAISVAESP